MAGPEFLSQLPTLEELLDNPRIKSTIDRVNRSNAASQVRAAVSGLGAEVSRRAEEWQSVSPGELLDKLVRRLSDPVAPVASPTINATGDPFHGGAATPLPAAARDAALASAEGFRIEAGAAAAEAVRLLPCEAAQLISSPVAAMGVAFEALASGGVVIVGRHEMRELAKGARLDEVAHRAGVTLREVGATDASTLADYESALNEAKANSVERLLVLHRPGGASAAPAAAEIAELAKRHGAVSLVECVGSRLRLDTPSYGEEVTSVEEMLNSGCDLTLTTTSGRLGGPVGGLLLGKQAVLDRITSSSASRADRVDPMIDSALAATLTLFEQPESLRFTHPLHQLLDAPLENLRTRAERLAPQIAAATGVAAAEAVEVAASASPTGLTDWCVEVTPEGDLGALMSMVEQRSPGLVLGQSEGRLLIDLRTVFAGQDRSIAAAFGQSPLHGEGVSATVS